MPIESEIVFQEISPEMSIADMLIPGDEENNIQEQFDNCYIIIKTLEKSDLTDSNVYHLYKDSIIQLVELYKEVVLLEKIKASVNGTMDEYVPYVDNDSDVCNYTPLVTSLEANSFQLLDTLTSYIDIETKLMDHKCAITGFKYIPDYILESLADDFLMNDICNIFDMEEIISTNVETLLAYCKTIPDIATRVRSVMYIYDIFIQTQVDELVVCLKNPGTKPNTIDSQDCQTILDYIDFTDGNVF